MCYFCFQEDSDSLYYEKHVGFSSDLPDMPDSQMKLRRRDTPHHLKNKRISLGNTKQEDAEEKVRAILASSTSEVSTNI